MVIGHNSYAAETNPNTTAPDRTILPIQEPKKPLYKNWMHGTPLKSRVDALDMPRENSGYLLPPPGTTDASSVATETGKNAGREIKEWQAIMDHLRNLPAKKGELPVIPWMSGPQRSGRSRWVDPVITIAIGSLMRAAGNLTTGMITG